MKIAKKDLTQKILKKYFIYDPITGWFTWKFKHCSKVIPGNRAGSVSNVYGHRVIHFAKSLYPEHRLAFLYMTGVFPKNHVDHIDHDELNNAWNNLREVTQAENNCNQSKRSDNKTGHTGIWINKANPKKKYMAEIHFNSKRVYLKSFYSLDDAIQARKKEIVKYPFHVNHGITKPT